MSLLTCKTFDQWDAAWTAAWGRRGPFARHVTTAYDFLNFISFRQLLLHRCLKSVYVICWPYSPTSQSSFKTPGTAIIPSALFNVCVCWGGVCMLFHPPLLYSKTGAISPYISRMTDLCNFPINTTFSTLWPLPPNTHMRAHTHSHTDTH